MSAVPHGSYMYTIRSTETDFQDKVHFQTLYSMLQEAAGENAEVYGWGSNTMDQLNLCWVLVRMSVRMTMLPAWKDKMHIETWSRGAEKLYVSRDFIIRDDSGHEIGKASSVWIVLDKNTHKPVRPQTLLDMALRQSDETAVFSFTSPKLSPVYTGEYMSDHLNESCLLKHADFSDIDRNGHVNNSKYIAWCIDAYYKNFSKVNQNNIPSIKGMDINYISELRFSDKINLFFTKKENNQNQIDGFVAETGKIAFSALLFTETDKKGEEKGFV